MLKVQDPLDGKGMVHVALCTKGEEPNRQYLFKFYPEQKEGVSLTEADLDCSDKPGDAIWIPVAATIGGEGNWGEGYTDPNHKTPDRTPNFGEGKQRYMAKLQDVPVIAKWMKDNNVSREGQKQDYICFLPVYIMQDGTPRVQRCWLKGRLVPHVLAEIPEKLGGARQYPLQKLCRMSRHWRHDQNKGLSGPTNLLSPTGITRI